MPPTGAYTTTTNTTLEIATAPCLVSAVTVESDLYDSGHFLGNKTDVSSIYLMHRAQDSMTSRLNVKAKNLLLFFAALR